MSANTRKTLGNIGQFFFFYFIMKSLKRSILCCLASLQMLHTTLQLILYMSFPYCKGFSRLWTVTSIKSPILKAGNPFRSGLHEEIGHHGDFIPEQLFCSQCRAEYKLFLVQKTVLSKSSKSGASLQRQRHHEPGRPRRPTG